MSELIIIREVEVKNLSDAKTVLIVDGDSIYKFPCPDVGLGLWGVKAIEIKSLRSPTKRGTDALSPFG